MADKERCNPWRRLSPARRALVCLLPLLPACGVILWRTAAMHSEKRPPLPDAAIPAGRIIPRTTVVRPGESLAAIAQRELGDPSRWPEIYQLNRDVIGKDPDRIHAGQVLTLHDELAVDSLRAIMPALAPETADAYIAPLNQAMWEFGVTTRERQACFLAQLAHESGELQHFEELSTGLRYEGRCDDLGNCTPGDGPRYKGRGPIQLTGRNNYRRAGAALHVGLEEHPELAARKEVGFRIAGWYFHDNGLNDLADRGLFSDITLRINGGHEGESNRELYFARARQVLHLPDPAAPDMGDMGE